MNMRTLLLCVAASLGACSTGDSKAPVAATSAATPAAPAATAQLANTYWKLVTLNDAPITTPEGARELHLVLKSEDRSVSGFSGCNRFSGSYLVEGAKITFSNIASTMMACAGDMSVEQRFHEMMGNAAGWKVDGETLQLTNASGAIVATFESRPVH